MHHSLSRLKINLFGAGLLALALLTGCGGGSSGGTAAGPNPQPVLLDAAVIPKFVAPLNLLADMPQTTPAPAGLAHYYEIAVRQFRQRILPAADTAGNPLGETTVWGYGSINHPGSFHYPALTIEAAADTPLRVKWINDLVDASGAFLPHLLPVDQTLHWANPAMDCIDNAVMTDCRGRDPNPYQGPVPIITHVHGAHVGPASDGYPEAWYLPAATNIPAGFATQGTHFGQFDPANTQAGTAVFQYPNDQRATTLWFHDHTLGITRLNVYAGMAGFYLLRGGASDLAAGVLPQGAFEIPLLIQDKSFYNDGSLFFPDNRAFFEGLEPAALQIPFIPGQTVGAQPSDVSPIWNPEFFGNTMVVNGNTWPFLEVEQRRYRFRMLNGSNSRFLILTTDNAGVVFHQIGADGGFLPAPVQLNRLLIGPGERADVIIDFTGIAAGTSIILQNLAPDEPFGGGEPGVDFEPADPATTGQVMQFRVVTAQGPDTSTAVADLTLPARTPLGVSTNVRRLSLNEDESATVLIAEVTDPGTGAVTAIVEDAAGVPFGPTSARLGTLDLAGNPVPLAWMEAVSENPALGATETWEIYNFTADAHPIHIHLVQFEIINRQGLVTNAEGMATAPAELVPGTVRDPEPGETGTKDTVIVYPGEMARVRALFDLAGLYVWHCHILDHEDNEMMRPFTVGP
jgi:bilirubin oxidase